MKTEVYLQLEEIIKDIPPLDESAMQAARARQNVLTKPRGSLGRLEELSIQLAGMKADPFPPVERKAVIIMAADHGVTAEGVSAYPAEVTAQMVLNFQRGGAAINVLARQAGARVTIVDIGIAADYKPLPGLVRRLRLPPPEDFLWQYVHSTPMADALADADEATRAALQHEVVSRWQPFVEDGALIVKVGILTAIARNR